MAKIGKEVEGKRYYGCPTLFVSADEYLNSLPKIKKIVRDEDLWQLYISDHGNILDMPSVANEFEDFDMVAVTLEVTRVPKKIPERLSIMLNITDGTSIEQLDALSYNDEVKVSVGTHVYCWNRDDAVLTFPDEFENDVEVNL